MTFAAAEGIKRSFRRWDNIAWELFDGKAMFHRGCSHAAKGHGERLYPADRLKPTANQSRSKANRLLATNQHKITLKIAQGKSENTPLSEVEKPRHFVRKPTGLFRKPHRKIVSVVRAVKKAHAEIPLLGKTGILASAYALNHDLTGYVIIGGLLGWRHICVYNQKEWNIWQ